MRAEQETGKGGKIWFGSHVNLLDIISVTARYRLGYDARELTLINVNRDGPGRP